jgi:hypothetical protein
MNNLEKNLDRILITKNWNNILIRNEIRKDILCFNENVNERLIVEYLHNLSSEQLLDVRQKCFKLASDHYVEIILNKIALKPLLKDIQSDDYPSKYVFKCNIMKDVIECLEYIIVNASGQNQMPERCVDFSINQRVTFPLGKRSLARQIETIKALRVKLLNYEEMKQSVKSYEEGFAKMEKSLILAKNRLQLMQTQNVFLKACLTVLLVILIVLTFLFLVTNCFNNKVTR